MGDKTRLINTSRSRVVAKQVKFAKTAFEKMRGLMFRKKPNYALVFPSSFPSRINLAIHMFFVFFPIDAVYLRGNRVVDMYKSVKPFTPYLSPVEPSDTLLELPVGSISRGSIRVGDVLAIR